MFLNSNKLTVNITKNTILDSMVHQKRPRIKGSPPVINTTDESGEDKSIEAEDNIRILGINLQQNLTWNAQLESENKALLPSFRKQLGQLKHIGSEIPMTCRLKLENSLILSRLNYGIQLWGAPTKSTSGKFRL